MRDNKSTVDLKTKVESRTFLSRASNVIEHRGYHTLLHFGLGTSVEVEYLSFFFFAYQLTWSC